MVLRIRVRRDSIRQLGRDAIPNPVDWTNDAPAKCQHENPQSLPRGYRSNNTG